MRLRNALVLVVVASAALMGTPTAQAEADRVGYGERISKKIVKHIRGTHYCQMKMDRPRTKVRLLFTKQSIHRRRYVLRVWIDRHDRLLRRAAEASEAASCFEATVARRTTASGSASTRTKGPGTEHRQRLLRRLADGQSFRAPTAGTCSAEGTANNWTPMEQMWVAERAYSSGRGFGPWPNTARMCGLR